MDRRLGSFANSRCQFLSSQSSRIGGKDFNGTLPIKSEDSFGTGIAGGYLSCRRTLQSTLWQIGRRPLRADGPHRDGGRKDGLAGIDAGLQVANEKFDDVAHERREGAMMS